MVAWLLVFCSVGALFGYSSPWLLLPTVLVAIPLYRRSLLRGALSPSARRLRAARAAEQLALSEFAVALDSYGVSTVRGFEEPQYPHVLARRTYEGGSFQWDLELTTGITVDVMRAQSEGFAVSFGASSVTFDRDTLNARKLTMTVIGAGDLLYADPLPATPFLSRGLGESITTPVPIGYTSTGEVVEVPFADIHGILSGTSGSGKSSAEALPVLAAAAADDCRLWLLDLKETDLQMFAPVAHRYFSGIEECSRGLAEVAQVLGEKKKQMKADGIRKLVPSARTPIDIIVADEVQELFRVHKTNDKPEKDRAAADTELVRHITATGRSAGVILLGATQRLSADLIPSAIGNNLGLRIGLRCLTRPQAEMAMGAQAYEQGAACDHIPRGFPGLGYVADDHGRLSHFRAYRLDDEAIRQRVVEIAVHKAANAVPVSLVKPDASAASSATTTNESDGAEPPVVSDEPAPIEDAFETRADLDDWNRKALKIMRDWGGEPNA